MYIFIKLILDMNDSKNCVACWGEVCYYISKGSDYTDINWENWRKSLVLMNYFQAKDHN